MNIYIMYVRQTIVQIRSYDMYIYTYKERERERERVDVI